MSITGPLDHIDLSIGDPDRSIPFYDAFFGALGFERRSSDAPDFQPPRPRRAAWRMRPPSGAWFEVEVRPAAPDRRTRRPDRYAPGLHHLAFHAASREVVERVHERMRAAGAEILDAPADYGGQPGYGPGYYAVFVADPDGLKLEVAHIPETNP